MHHHKLTYPQRALRSAARSWGKMADSAVKRCIYERFIGNDEKAYFCQERAYEYAARAAHAAFTAHPELKGLK